MLSYWQVSLTGTHRSSGKSRIGVSLKHLLPLSSWPRVCPFAGFVSTSSSSSASRRRQRPGLRAAIIDLVFALPRRQRPVLRVLILNLARAVLFDTGVICECSSSPRTRGLLGADSRL